MKKRIVALFMALSLLASVCVFTANADEPGVVVNSASELIDALKTANTQITLGSDIVLNEGYTFAYDETNAVIIVSDANGIVAKVSTGEAEGSTPGAVIEGSLDALTKWTPLENLNGADIDGNGHTIKGLYINGDNSTGGAFVKTIRVGESVKNLNFENSLVITSYVTRPATLTSMLYGDIYDMEFKNSFVIGNPIQQFYMAGGAVAAMWPTVDGTTVTYSPTADGITFDGAVFAKSTGATYEISTGGVIAHVKGGTVKNCANYGTVKTISGSTYAAGGVIGLVEPTGSGASTSGANGAPRDTFIYNNANYGKIVSNNTANKYAGGVIGRIDIVWSASQDVLVHNLYNAGEIVNGREVIGHMNNANSSSPVGDTMLHYCFAPATAEKEVLSPSRDFNKDVLTIAKDTNRKMLVFLNHGATAYEGLKTWKIDGDVLKMTDTDAVYDANFVAKDITTDTSLDDLTIVSAKVLNNAEIEITFSLEVLMNYGVSMAICYIDEDGNIAKDGETDLQFALNGRSNGSKKIIAKLDSSVTKTMAEIVNIAGYEEAGYELMFCIEGLPTDAIATRIPGEIEEISAVYGKKNLVATATDPYGVLDRYYIELTGTENASVAYTEDTKLPEPSNSKLDVNPAPIVSLDPVNTDGVSILSAKVINKTQIEIEFSEAVAKKADFFAAIRYTDNKLVPQMEGETPLQFYGNLSLDGTNKGIFTYDPAQNGGKTLFDVLIRTGYETEVYSVYFCIEGLPIEEEDYEHQVGYIDNITSADGTKLLSAVVASETDASHEGYYIAITNGIAAAPEDYDPNAPDFDNVPDDGVKIVSAKVISKTEIEITFSEPVKRTGNVWRGIRYTDLGLNLVKDDSTFLQWFTSITASADPTKVVLTYTPGADGKTLYDILTMKGYEDKGYYVVCGFEGMDTAGANKNVGYVDNFASASDPTKFLGANKSSSDGIFDKCYAPIEDIEVAKPEEVRLPDFTVPEGSLKIESAKAINETQIEITFSEAVTVSTSPYCAIRYIDADLNKKSESGKVLQFEGNIEFNGKTATFTYKPTGYGNEGKSLYEVLTLRGREDKGYFVAFVIEGKPIDGFDGTYQSSLIDNIVSTADSTRLLAANKALADGIYDACYAPIDDVENAKPAPVDPTLPPDYSVPEGSLKIESVKALNQFELEITFSEEVKLVGNVFRGIRYTDNQFKLKSDNGVVLQYTASSFTINGNKATFKYDPDANSGKSLYDILTMKGYEDKGYYVSMCLEGLASSSIAEPLYGYVDNIVSVADPTKSLVANKPADSGVIYDGHYAPITDIEKSRPPKPGENTEAPTVDMTPTENGITIESAKVINETQIEVTFSEPVTKLSGVWAGIRYTNSALKIAQDLSLEDPNLQFYSSSFTFDGTNKAIFTFVPSDNRCLYDILNRRGYEKKNYFVYFCIEGLPSNAIPAPVHGYIDNITSLDGTKLLASNKPSPDKKGLYDGYYVEIEDGELSKPADYVKKPFYDVEALSATLLNDKEIEVTFSEPVNLVGSIFKGIRYVDENNNLQKDGSTYLQFELDARFNNSRKAIFKLKDNSTLTMAEILSFKGYEDKGYKIAICIEGLPTSQIIDPIKGYVDNVQTYDGRGMLIANKVSGQASDKIYDGVYLEIQNQENVSIEFTEDTPLPTPEIPKIPLDPDILAVPDDGLKVLSCKVLNSTQIEFTFSESVETIGFYFRGIRYVNRNLGLRTDNGKYLQWDFGTPVIEGNKMIFQWGKTDITMVDVLNMKGYEDSGYYLTFCFEGYTNSAIGSYKVGYVDNIIGSKSKKKLGANKPNPDGIYDGFYTEITGLENLKIAGPKPGEVPIKKRPNFTLVSATVINPSQIELIFSEPVMRNSNFFAAVRYTNADMVVQQDKSLTEPYLQFTGSSLFDGSERVIWTLSASSTKSLYEILNFKGYENKGYKLYFCIEGLPSTKATKEPGYIDNITSIDGKKLLKGTPKRAEKGGVYDGVYVKINDIDKAKPIEVPDLEGIYVDQIEALSNYKLELLFSEPVYIVGMGTEATQYNALKACVRYVDPKTYAVVKYNGKVMEFSADLYVEDGSTIATFELRSDEITFKDLFDMVGYEDLKETAIPVLCLEGTEDKKLLPLPYPGYVDNIQNVDGTNMLTAMIANNNGVNDVWIATADEIKFEIRKTEIEQLKEILASSKLTSADLDALNAMDEATLKKTLTKAKELIEGLKSGEMTEAGVAAFDKLLSKNGIDNAEKVKAMMFTVGETFNIGFPALLNLDVSEREYSAADTVYVYKVNADGTVSEIAQRDLTVYVADEIITRVEFADSVIGDYFVTNARLELPQPFNPAIIAYIAIAVMVLAIVGLVIFLVVKNKKEKKA